MVIVRCALYLIVVWSATGAGAARSWSRHFGTEIHLLSSSKNAVFDRRTRRLVDTIEQKLTLNGRLVILLCARRCYPAQSEIPRWIREFSDQHNMTALGEQFTYQFYDNRRSSALFNDVAIRNSSQAHLVYVVDGRLFRYNGNLSNKEEFLSFLRAHEAGGTEIISNWQQLETVISNAQCPMPHYQLVVRAFDGVANYSFFEMIAPLPMDMYIELYTRLPELPFVCQLILLLQNNGYVWISADADVHEVTTFSSAVDEDLIIEVESLENAGCTESSSASWYPIRSELTMLERDYLREHEQSSALESEPSYILVGATGGIAVVALAISIFWGLNGSTFARQ
ncbi:unnamed protein product [Gongylonema pulchrum]|uniref:Thioredoxin domain-containing protein n=1 Tax=Gongylonema pulchrum TaxID=637853 RepID=A0A183EJ13_9BILA|nr:unnamed protein product [Gongylonema pulchrum]